MIDREYMRIQIYAEMNRQLFGLMTKKEERQTRNLGKEE